MPEKLRWKQILEKFPDQWVAISNYSDDPDFPTRTQGVIYATGKDKKELVLRIKEKGKQPPLSLQFAGERLPENFHGGLWFQPNQEY